MTQHLEPGTGWGVDIDSLMPHCGVMEWPQGPEVVMVTVKVVHMVNGECYVEYDDGTYEWAPLATHDEDEEWMAAVTLGDKRKR